MTARLHYQANREKAAALINQLVKVYSSFYGVSPGRISIRNQRTRWGSCSKKGNLNFNYRLLFLDPKLSEYVVAHEICHLLEFNHSRSFWSLVAKTIPDYSLRRRALKEIKL